MDEAKRRKRAGTYDRKFREIVISVDGQRAQRARSLELVQRSALPSAASRTRRLLASAARTFCRRAVPAAPTASASRPQWIAHRHSRAPAPESARERVYPIHLAGRIAMPAAGATPRADARSPSADRPLGVPPRRRRLQQHSGTSALLDREVCGAMIHRWPSSSARPAEQPAARMGRWARPVRAIASV